MNGSGAAIPVVITRFLMPVLVSEGLASKGFRHGFTTRDARLEDVGLSPSSVYLVSQVHGSSVVVASGDPAAFRAEQADAIVVGEGQAGAIRVADCVPVLVGDTESGRAAAIHAGWRGVASGVVPSAIATLRARPLGLVAAIGPCIEACCFEVGTEVADELSFAVPAPGVVVKRDDVRGKAWVDLVAAVRAQLEACGVPAAQIERVGGCTKHDAGAYHSYRRDGASSGRMFGVIVGRGAVTAPPR
jgi:YfiH family protein